jgi:hypothetical protein
MFCVLLLTSTIDNIGRELVADSDELKYILAAFWIILEWIFGS